MNRTNPTAQMVTSGGPGCKQNLRLCVDTAAVTDSRQPYETGIQHPKYNCGKWVIVELYDSKKEAQKGHDKWVKIMTAKALPKTLKNVSSCDICELGRAIEGGDWEDEFEYAD